MRNTLLLAKKLKKRHVQYLIVAVFFLFLGFSSVGAVNIGDLSFYYDLSDCPDGEVLGSVNLTGTQCEDFLYVGNPLVTSIGGIYKDLYRDTSVYTANGYLNSTVLNNQNYNYYTFAMRTQGGVNTIAHLDINYNSKKIFYFYCDNNTCYMPDNQELNYIDDGIHFELYNQGSATGYETVEVFLDYDNEKYYYKMPDYFDWLGPFNFGTDANSNGQINLGSRQYGRITNIGGGNITDPFEPEVYNPFFAWDYDIGIEILTPEINSTIELPNGTTTTTGNWIVKEYSRLSWDRIYAVVKDLATGNNFLFYDEITGTASTTGSFSIDLDLPDGNYSICWASTGTQIPYVTRWAYFFCEEENRTILRVGDYPELPRYILLENFEPCDYEDCDNLNVLETLTCRISNFLTSLTCPDPEKLLDLQLTIEEMKNRFPVSYLKLVRQEYNFLREEIQEKNSISMSIFGNETEINVNYFEEVTDENDIPLMSYIKTFINGLIALSFVLYGIYFIKRIF